MLDNNITLRSMRCAFKYAWIAKKQLIPPDETGFFGQGEIIIVQAM